MSLYLMRRTQLLLVTGAIASACTPDAPITGPDVGPDSATALPVALNGAVAAGAKVRNTDPSAGVNDALTRLVPSLGPWGAAIGDALLRVQGMDDGTAWTNVQRVIDALSTTVTDELRPDFDALRLELGIAISQ
jgi:hypothetical protein